MLLLSNTEGQQGFPVIVADTQTVCGYFCCGQVQIVHMHVAQMHVAQMHAAHTHIA